MQEGTKLVCGETLIHVNNGKAYGRQGKAPTGLNFIPSILLELAKRCKIIYFVQFLA